MTGMIMIVTEAAIRPKSVPYLELICSNSVEIGNLVLSRIMIFCTKRSLYDHRKLKIATVDKDGLQRGTIILPNTWNTLAPSIYAASSISIEIPCINPIMIKVAKLRFPAIWGRITATFVFSRFQDTIIRKTGMIVENTGNIRLATKSVLIAAFPLNSYLVIAKERKAAKSITPIVTLPDIIRLFLYALRTFNLEKALI